MEADGDVRAWHCEEKKKSYLVLAGIRHVPMERLSRQLHKRSIGAVSPSGRVLIVHLDGVVSQFPASAE